MPAKYLLISGLCLFGVALTAAADVPVAPPPVVTVGQLADVTADLVIDTARADFVKAQRAAGGMPVASTSPEATAMRPDAPSIDGVSRVGRTLYVALHYRDGSVGSVPVGESLVGGYRLEQDGDGAQVVDAATGLVLNRSSSPAPAAPANGVVTFPTMNSRPMPMAPPVVTPPPPRQGPSPAPALAPGTP